MGFDVSYHPISEKEMNEWYFDRLVDVKNQDFRKINSLAREFAIDGFYVERYMEIIKAGLMSKENDSFEETHGFYVAAIQGLFRKFFYTRGVALSFLIEENVSIAKYTKSWEEILGTEIDVPVANKIIENYSSGVYIPHERLKELYIDYNRNPKFRETLSNHFSHGRIKVFMTAVMYSIDNKMGLLEATEVVELNPIELSKSKCFSKISNCDRDGVLLYQQMALEEKEEAQENEVDIEEFKEKDGLLSKIINIFRK